MKATELRKGNYVGFHHWFRNGKLFKKYKDSFIETVSVHHGVLYNEEWVDAGYSLNSIIGIPLTEEWLIKFGFKHDGDDYYSLKGVDIKNFKEGGMKVVGIVRHVYNVHSLQNLYFALTGTELTLKEELKIKL